MAEHMLIIPDSILDDIKCMRYTGMETLEYCLSLEVPNSNVIATLMLIRIRAAEPSPSMSITADPQAHRILEDYLNADPNHSVVILHSHPVEGPSGGDSRAMIEIFRSCDRLRYAIFVGPRGPKFYETDGKNSFPIVTPILAVKNDEKVRNLQIRIAQEYSKITMHI